MSDKRVHCKDCKYYNAPVEMCMRAGGDKSPARPTDYCEYGETDEPTMEQKISQLTRKFVVKIGDTLDEIIVEACMTFANEVYRIDKKELSEAIKKHFTHGTWKRPSPTPKSYTRICSCCGKKSYMIGVVYPLCPWCGAKINGKEQTL